MGVRLQAETSKALVMAADLFQKSQQRHARRCTCRVLNLEIEYDDAKARAKARQVACLHKMRQPPIKGFCTRGVDELGPVPKGLEYCDVPESLHCLVHDLQFVFSRGSLLCNLSVMALCA